MKRHIGLFIAITVLVVGPALAASQAAMNQFFPNRSARTALADLVGDVRLIVAIASLTMSDRGQSPLTSSQASRIAIGLYRPAPGGVAFGGRIEPAALELPGLHDVPRVGHAAN